MQIRDTGMAEANAASAVADDLADAVTNRPVNRNARARPGRPTTESLRAFHGSVESLSVRAPG
jgi:hypothetical protein